jgi:hypothetical protein
VASVCCSLRCVSMSEIEREADLADRLASRILESAERGTLSSDELWENPDLTLITNAARLLQEAGAEFPRQLCRLAARASAAAARARVDAARKPRLFELRARAKSTKRLLIVLDAPRV